MSGKPTPASGLRPAIRVNPENKDDDVWLRSIYDITQITDEDIKEMFDSFAYKGFDRQKTIKQLKEAIPDPKMALRAIVAVALRGPSAGSKIKLNGNLSLQDMRIPSGGGKGKDSLNCNRIGAATADMAAYVLKRMKVPKRLNVDCPGWLQFPAAGSIKLPNNLRTQHIEFSKIFSKQIGGEFNEQIYAQMEMNAYLDENLHLFDVP